MYSSVPRENDFLLRLKCNLKTREHSTFSFYLGINFDHTALRDCITNEGAMPLNFERGGKCET